ncbi:hypothetical protein VPH35_020690 [Triticum aestivum]
MSSSHGHRLVVSRQVAPHRRWTDPGGPVAGPASLAFFPLTGAPLVTRRRRRNLPDLLLTGRRHASPPPLPANGYTETDTAATQYDYVVDDPSLLAEQPDDGAQEPDATIDDDYYYSGGAYYYVQPADDDQE